MSHNVSHCPFFFFLLIVCLLHLYFDTHLCTESFFRRGGIVFSAHPFINFFTMSKEKEHSITQGLTNQQRISHLQGMQQPPSDDANNSSLIYDRTTKVAKAEYADHGSHGVAAVPMPSDTGMMCYGNIGGRGLPSSVQMQHQMQQIAASMLQQQQLQSQQQQLQQQQQQMLPFAPSATVSCGNLT